METLRLEIGSYLLGVCTNQVAARALKPITKDLELKNPSSGTH